MVARKSGESWSILVADYANAQLRLGMLSPCSLCRSGEGTRNRADTSSTSRRRKERRPRDVDGRACACYCWTSRMTTTTPPRHGGVACMPTLPLLPPLEVPPPPRETTISTHRDADALSHKTAPQHEETVVPSL